ncbi:MAG: 2Fe-2S iron-sulfur cluster-binding protein [Candidatus Peregrinibacteria bacterium]|nr:2Fe-2S iron-sulfur cluster-binding protein [Candidatus Peregrinibacteria bacterium]
MPQVTFQNTEQSAQANDDQVLREVTQNNGWPIPYGCENGICGTCLITIPSGKENLSAAEEIENQTLQAMGKGDGEHRLACQCKVNGDVTIAQ